MERIVFFGNFNDEITSNTWSSYMNYVIHPHAENHPNENIPMHQRTVARLSGKEIDTEKTVGSDIYTIKGGKSCKVYFEEIIKILRTFEDDPIIVVTEKVILSDFHPRSFTNILDRHDIVMDVESKGDVIIGRKTNVILFLVSILNKVTTCSELTRTISTYLSSDIINRRLKISEISGLVGTGNTMVRQTRTSRPMNDNKILFESFKSSHVAKELMNFAGGIVDVGKVANNVIPWGILIILLIILFIRWLVCGSPRRC